MNLFELVCNPISGQTGDALRLINLFILIASNLFFNDSSAKVLAALLPSPAISRAFT
jgi:hypothetical protein